MLVDVLQSSEQTEQHMDATMYSTSHSTSLLTGLYIEIVSELNHLIDAKQHDHLLAAGDRYMNLFLLPYQRSTGRMAARIIPSFSDSVVLLLRYARNVHSAAHCVHQLQ